MSCFKIERATCHHHFRLSDLATSWRLVHSQLMHCGWGLCCKIAQGASLLQRMLKTSVWDSKWSSCQIYMLWPGCARALSRWLRGDKLYWFETNYVVKHILAQGYSCCWRMPSSPCLSSISDMCKCSSTGIHSGGLDCCRYEVHIMCLSSLCYIHTAISEISRT